MKCLSAMHSHPVEHFSSCDCLSICCAMTDLTALSYFTARCHSCTAPSVSHPPSRPPQYTNGTSPQSIAATSALDCIALLYCATALRHRYGTNSCTTRYCFAQCARRSYSIVPYCTATLAAPHTLHRIAPHYTHCSASYCTPVMHCTHCC